jgi:thiamine transport system substrate-binding protein
MTISPEPAPAGRRRPGRRVAGLLALFTALALLAVACGDDGGERGAANPDEVVLLTHGSFAISDELVEAFESETGFALRVLSTGDAVSALNQAILTIDNPQGDVLFGVDELTLSRAFEAGLFEPYEAEGLDRVPAALLVDDEHRVTPMDHGAVCVNYDRAWFDDAEVPEPASLDDLADPAYEGLLVVQNPAESTPGLAFLVATIAEYGEDGWQDYWRRLLDNDVLVTSGWEEAYYGYFSGPSSEGDRPLVVSYGTSPPYEVDDRGPLPDEAPTGVIESTCVRQVEFAGVLTNAPNPEGARRLVDFLLSDAFQVEIPDAMYVFPVVDTVELPELFERYAVVPAETYQLDSATFEAGRDRWLREWTDLVLR